MSQKIIVVNNPNPPKTSTLYCKGLRIVGIIAVFWLITWQIKAMEDQPSSGSLRLPMAAPQEVACWFWTESTFKPDGYKEMIDLYARFTSFRLLTAALRAGKREPLTDPTVFQQVKEAADYARSRGIGLLLDLNVCNDLTGFLKASPEELCCVVSLQTMQMMPDSKNEVVIPGIAFHGCPSLGYEPGGLPDYKLPPASLLRAYCYEINQGVIKAGTLFDVTKQCRQSVADDGSVRVYLNWDNRMAGKYVTILGAEPSYLAEMFAPHYIPYQNEILKRYASAGLAGAGKDEGGDPAVGLDRLPWSVFRQDAYREATKGRDLLADFLLMRLGEEGRETERLAAINHHWEFIRNQNAKVEKAFYDGTKEYFGSDAYVGTHPTWVADPNFAGEYQRNGLDWWAVKRDVAQTDENIPYGVATAMSKKLGSPFWQNMYYATDVDKYRRFWAYALSGGRMNFHPIFPPATSIDNYTALFKNAAFMHGEQRVRLLNLISPKPLDCPVAVVFGHASAMNYAGPHFQDSGTTLAAALWAAGYPADLIPTSEIENHSLKVGKDGYVYYGAQRYTAIVFYHPEFEKPETVEFWQQAGHGKTALFRLGHWTRDFEAKPLDGDALLPANIKLVSSAKECLDAVSSRLRAENIEPQKAGGMTGNCRLLDGTRIFITAEGALSGDPLVKTVQIQGQAVSFDAEGIAAVRLDKDGKTEAIVAGGLKSFQGGGLAMALPTRADIALWRDARGRWHGALQGWIGAVPDNLKGLAEDWLFLTTTGQAIQVPESLKVSGDASPVTTSSSVDRNALRLPDGMPPVIGAWFPQENEIARSEGYRDFLDAAAEHSHYNLLTTSMRDGARQMVDPAVHDWFKKAAVYARNRGIGLVLEIDPRHSIAAFKEKYPDEMQERLWLRECDLNSGGEATVVVSYEPSHGDAICAAVPVAMGLERIYTYIRTAEGIDPASVRDITAAGRVKQAEARSLSLAIASGAENAGRKVCVIARVTFDYPAVFAPHLIPFEAAIARQYADLPLAGLMKDEWGFPFCADGNLEHNGYWFSRFQSEAYARKTGGRDLIRDALLMWTGEVDRKAERQAAINQVMELNRSRNTEIEQAFYQATKATFGPDAFVGTHDTVFPYPDVREFLRNGLNWWTAKRDFAQSDETTPFCCRTSMAKKMGSPVWYNQWYTATADSYSSLVWSYALAGGRMNFHILWPGSTSAAELGKDLLRSSVVQADCRIRLLNAISSAPVDCPVAVIFGHACAMNWVGPGFDDVGVKLADVFWRAGYYADLIPSSEIANKALHVDDLGNICLGQQRYAAVVLYHPEFETPQTAEFFQQGARGKTLLYRLGDWTRDFAAQSFDGNSALPRRMKAMAEIQSCGDAVISDLRARGIEPQTLATVTLPKWRELGGTSAALPSSGRSRLLDGTVILVRAEKNTTTGDPIHETLKLGDQSVYFDAMGIAAVRLDQKGEVEAIAAGGLKSFQAGQMTIELPSRADVALWRDVKGQWRGMLQGHEGEVPEALTKITRNWLRLRIPDPLK